MSWLPASTQVIRRCDWIDSRRAASRSTVKTPFADLGVDLLVLVQTQQQTLAVSFEGRRSPCSATRKVRQHPSVNLRQIDCGQASRIPVASNWDSDESDSNAFGLCIETTRNVHVGGEKPPHVTQDGRFTHPPPPVQDDARAARAEHNLAFQFANHLGRSTKASSVRSTGSPARTPGGSRPDRPSSWLWTAGDRQSPASSRRPWGTRN